MTPEQRSRRQTSQRAWERRQRDPGSPSYECPDCGAMKRTHETLQAHRGIAHGILLDTA